MLNQKHWLRLVVGLLAITNSRGPLFAQEGAAGRVEFRLRETAGLRRFGYPVHATLPLPESPPGRKYRLLRDGREVAAQFREIAKPTRGNGSGGTGLEVALDFTTSPGPFESENYVVEYGKDIQPGPEPRQGLVPEHGDGVFRIANGSQIAYTIPDDLKGLVTSIKTPGEDYLTPHSRGLFLVERTTHSKTPLKLARRGDDEIARVTRQGPIAVGLRFDGIVSLSDGQALPTTVDLDFVHSKSWIETTWSINDPEDRIEGLGVDLEMNIDRLPALVDCGAGSTVYSHLRKNEVLTLLGRPAGAATPDIPRWVIEQGQNEARTEFARAAANAPPPEGWIHLMDHARCSALAVADFANAWVDRFRVESSGRMEFERRYETAPASPKSTRHKTLKFWLHVVPMPVQIGAVTSPQAMLSPLIVEWNQ